MMAKLQISSCLLVALLSLRMVSGDVTVTVSETENGVELVPTGSLIVSSSDVSSSVTTTPQSPNTTPSVSAVKSAGQLSQLAILNSGNQAYNTFTIMSVNEFSFACLKDGSASVFIGLRASSVTTIGFNQNKLIFSGDIDETTFVGGSLLLTSANLAATDFVPNSMCFITFGANPVKRVEFVVEDIASASPSSAPTETPDSSDDEGCGNFGIGFVFCIIGEGFSSLVNLVIDFVTGIF